MTTNIEAGTNMLKKILQLKLNIILVVISALILLQLITAYVFGFIIQKQKDLEFDHFLGTLPVIKVLKRDYHRGFFASDMNVELMVNSDTIANILKVLPNNESETILHGHNYALKYTTHIEHGLFSGMAHGNFLPLLSYATTEIKYSDNIRKLLKKFFNEKQPVTITDITYLNKSGRILISSPKFDYEEAVSGVKVIWGGMSANLGYNKNLTSFHNSFSIPDLQLIAPTKGKVLVHAVDYVSDTKYSANNIKIGTTKLNVALAHIAWKDKIKLNFKLGDVLKMITGINSAEFLNEIDAINPSNFTFNNISYAATSDDVNNFFNAQARIQFNSLVTDGSTYGPLDFALAISHVPSRAFSKLADDIERFSANASVKTDDSTQRDKFIQLLKNDFVPILVASPLLNLSKFELNTSSGVMKISSQATTKQFEAGDINDQDKFISKLAINLDFSLPKPVVAYLFILQMKYLLSAGNAELDSQSSEALTKVVNILLDNQINTWTKRGYLKVNNGILQSNLVLRDGKLIINGIPTK